ncbi:PfWMP3_18 [Phormidium phage Pf-WMP3]|uniref:PfWMP3_18 n=1 Tax=Phormidium phage Pf-WMP3 TaxID=2914005 RepID=A5HL51_9CAUD|nr:PfWMP3_18 [Phormidium phage Pf-WMP3]ABQ12458.1 PfWMP3_18 [Phormidium phage Pf-WMP3]
MLTKNKPTFDLTSTNKRWRKYMKKFQKVTMSLCLLALMAGMTLLAGCEEQTDTYENNFVTCGRDELGMLTCKGKLDVR